MASLLKHRDQDHALVIVPDELSNRRNLKFFEMGPLEQ